MIIPRCQSPEYANEVDILPSLASEEVFEEESTSNGSRDETANQGTVAAASWPMLLHSSPPLHFSHVLSSICPSTTIRSVRVRILLSPSFSLVTNWSVWNYSKSSCTSCSKLPARNGMFQQDGKKYFFVIYCACANFCDNLVHASVSVAFLRFNWRITVRHPHALFAYFRRAAAASMFNFFALKVPCTTIFYIFYNLEYCIDLQSCVRFAVCVLYLHRRIRATVADRFQRATIPQQINVIHRREFLNLVTRVTGNARCHCVSQIWI